jgi:Pin2-interacting protein X1
MIFVCLRNHQTTNLHSDATKFGQTYLSKLGWDSSKGLGVAGDGRTSHIKVSQKLDMLGIGAANSKDPNGIAWKQNKDFEALLKRLNEAGEVADGARGDVPVVEIQSMGKGEEDMGRKRKVDGADTNEKRERKKRKRENDVDGSISHKKQKVSQPIQSDDATPHLDLVDQASVKASSQVNIVAPRPMGYV